MNTKKLLSLVLALVMIFTMIPAQIISTNANIAPDDEQGRNAFAVNDIYVTLDDGALEDGFFEGLVRVDYNFTGDGTSLVTTLGQTVVIDTSVLQPVSYSEGTSILDACKSAEALQFGTTDLAINAAENKIGRKTYSYGFGSTGLTSYNANTGNLYIFICGMHTDGAPLTATPTRVGSIFLKLADGKTNADVKNAIWLMKDSEDNDPTNGCAAPAIYPDVVSTKDFKAANVPTTNISFSDDFETSTTTYDITFNWKDASGDKTDTQTVDEGATPVVPDGATANYSDADYDYTFTGWDKNVVAANADATYTAQYSHSADKTELQTLVNECAALNEDDYTEDSWAPFAAALSAANDVINNADAKKSDVSNAKAALQTAKDNLQTKSVTVTYDITFNWTDADGEKSSTVTVNEGEVPTAPTVNDYTSADGNYSYTFTGWDKDVVAANADATYTAQFRTTTNYADYAAVDNAIDFANEQMTMDNYTAKYTEASRNALADAVNAVVRDKLASEQADVNAMAEAITQALNFLEVAKYDITFSTHNGTNTAEVYYGETPEVPAGATDGYSEGDYDYAFTGWDSDIVPVTAAKTYTAQYDNGTFVPADTSALQDAVTAAEAKRDNGTEWTADSVSALNDAIDAAGEYLNAPTAPGRSAQDAINAATDAVNNAANALSEQGATYYAITFNWKNAEGDQTTTINVKEGETPNAPEVADYANGDYDYTFTGWDRDIVAAIENTTYTAKFEENFVPADYTAYGQAVEAAQTKQQEANYADKYTQDSRDAVEDALSTNVAGLGRTEQATVDAATTAINNAVDGLELNQFIVTYAYKNANGEDTTATEYVAYGEEPANVPAPADYSVGDYDYNFTGWDKDFAPVYAATTYTAQYEENFVPADYTAYGEAAAAAQEKTDEANYADKYTQDSRDALEDALSTNVAGLGRTEQATVDAATAAINNALDNLTVNEYTVTFVTNEGPAAVTYAYGETPEAPVVLDYADGDYDYTFTGWDKDIVPVTEDATYTAQYEETFVPADYADNNAAVQAARDAIQRAEDEGFDYTEDSLAALNDALANNVIAGLGRTHQDEVDAAADTIFNAVEGLRKEGVNYYTVTFNFVDSEGKADTASFTVEEGTDISGYIPDLKGTSYKGEDGKTYTFTGWDNPIEEIVKADAEYTAEYEPAEEPTPEFVPDMSEIEALVNRYEQMKKTGKYNESDLATVKAYIDDIYATNFQDQKTVDEMAEHLEVLINNVRKVDSSTTKKSTTAASTSASTGDNATLVVMSIVLVSALGLAVISLKKRRREEM